MIKYIIGVMVMAVAAVMLCTGCNETEKIPTVEKITSVSTLIGKTAGYACELSKTKTSVKDGIIKVLDVASKVVPGTNQTFTAAWSPIVNDEISKLNLGDAEKTIVKTALTVACEGIDYVFVKYPKAKTTQELVSAAVTGFIGGYKSVGSLAAGSVPEYDENAYIYLRSKMQ